MKRTNGVRAAYDAFLLRLPLGALPFSIHPNKPIHPWPLIVLCCHCSASFAEACKYVNIGDAVFIGHIPK